MKRRCFFATLLAPLLVPLAKVASTKELGPTGRVLRRIANRDSEYQYVRLDLYSQPPKPGQLAYWMNPEEFIVTVGNTSLSTRVIAGVFMARLTPGYYGFIAVRGPCKLDFIASKP